MVDQLAATAASALVGAIATDAWAVAKAGFARLFGGGEKRRQELVETRLANAASQLEQASSDERVRLRQDLAADWRVRLQDLLEDRPKAAEELRALTEQVRARLPQEQQTWVQQNIARDHSTLFANQGGAQHVHYHTAPGTPGNQRTSEGGGVSQ